jgi:hypothetical protein
LELISLEVAFCSLALCILKEVTPDQALIIIDPETIPDQGLRKKAEAEIVVQLKEQNLTWTEIGWMFGISEQAAWKRGHRLKQEG